MLEPVLEPERALEPVLEPERALEPVLAHNYRSRRLWTLSPNAGRGRQPLEHRGNSS